MIQAFSVVLFFVCILILVHLITSVRKVTLAGALALGFSAFIALESTVLNILSFFQYVSRGTLLAIHVFFVALWVAWVWRAEGEQRRLAGYIGSWSVLVKRYLPEMYVFLPLLILSGMCAFLFGPNNYDSLTYHMARVAHWIQNSSIAYFPTINDRQNVMGPGAEYIILFFQLLTGTDVLAPAVQWFAFVCLFFAVQHLGRVLRVPRAWSLPIALIAISSPIAVMEASNTKNDLVAALMACSLVIAGIRMVKGNLQRKSLVDYGLVGMVAAAGYLVKPTSLLVALPVLLCGLLSGNYAWLTNRGALKRIAAGTCLCVFVFISIAGPDLYRKYHYKVDRSEVYPIFAEYTGDRFWNPVRVLAHNIPFIESTRNILKAVGYEGEIITKDVFNLQEDMIGNPWQVCVFLGMVVVTLLSGVWAFRDRTRLRAYCLSLAPLGAWIAFGLVVRDQGWITRLEMPLFFILPFSFVYFGVWARARRKIFVLSTVILHVVAFFSMAYGLLVSCKIPARPLFPVNFWGEKSGRIQTYYNNTSHLRAAHDSFLAEARRQQCNRIGLIMGPDSAEYPLTWRAMQAGMQTRHLRQSVQKDQKIVYMDVPQYKDWPCMIYAADGVVEHVPGRGEQWISAGDYHTFVWNYAIDFEQSSHTLMKIDRRSGQKVVALQDVEIRDNEEVIECFVSGNDPQLILPTVDLEGAQQALVKLQMDSSVNTSVQLFYQTPEFEGYKEENSLTRLIHTGENTIYFPLDMTKATGRQLRLDIAKEPGLYRIAKIEIREMAPQATK